MNYRVQASCYPSELKLTEGLQIESQNSLKTRNSTMLTFLAAVYVPLAFVTVRLKFIIPLHMHNTKPRPVFPWYEHHRVLDAVLDKLQHKKLKFGYPDIDKLKFCPFQFCKYKQQPRKPESPIVEHECVWHIVRPPFICDNYSPRNHGPNDQMAVPNVHQTQRLLASCICPNRSCIHYILLHPGW